MKAKNNTIRCILLALILCGGIAYAETTYWSNTAYWGGVAPQAGQSVTIPQGDTVILDTQTPALGDLMIEGTLRFAEGNIALTATNIYVKGGLLQIGSREVPYQGQARVEINGSKGEYTVEGHSSEGRHLIVGHGGQLEIHGSTQPQRSWTKLTQSISAGDSVITLSDPVGWNPGDKIFIAPSGYKAGETELRTVRSVSADGSEIMLDQSVSFDHFGEIITVEGRQIDMRAEVGLLTRNIRFEAPASTAVPTSEDFQFGFHGMFLHGSDIHIENAEFIRGGQTGLKARYPLHWHHAMNATGDYISNVTVRDSHQRGIVVHRTRNVLVDSNVVFNIKGHGIVFSEDGDESNNIFTNNLVTLIRNKSREEMAFPIKGHFVSSQAENRPAGFWGRNYNNTFIGNHVAAIEFGLGFFFDDLNMPVEREVITDTPTQLKFDQNLVHAIERVEKKVYYGPQASGHALMVGRYGAYMTKPGLGNGELVFQNLTAYKIDGFGAWVENEKHTIDNARFAQTSVGVFNRRSTVKNSLIVQSTPNKIGGDQSPINRGNQRTGYGIVVKNGTPESYPYLENNTFVSMTRAAIGALKGGLQELGSPVIMVSTGAKLVNTKYAVDFQIPNGKVHGGIPELFTTKEINGFPFDLPKAEGVFLDLDGSLRGDGVPAYYSFGALQEVGTSTFNWNYEFVREKRDGTVYRLLGLYFYTPLQAPPVVQPPEPTPAVVDEVEPPVTDGSSDLAEIIATIDEALLLFDRKVTSQGEEVQTLVDSVIKDVGVLLESSGLQDIGKKSRSQRRTIRYVKRSLVRLKRASRYVKRFTTGRRATRAYRELTVVNRYLKRVDSLGHM